MTTPALHGYPDWGRQAAESDIEVYYVQNEVIAALTTHGPLFVGGIQALYLSFEGSATRNRIMFSYYLDAAMTKLVDNDGIVINGAGYYTGPIPVFGPYVVITLEASAYPATVSTRLSMASHPASASGGEGSAGRIIHGNPTTVPGVTTTTVFANASWRGAAVLYARLPAVASELYLESLQLSGLVRITYELIGNGLRETVELALHTDAYRMRLVNPSAGPVDFRYQLIGKREGG